jgi:preprotein translocase subunit SecG
MQTVIIVIHLMIIVAMIGFILLQKSEGGGLGIGSTGGFMTGRGTRNVLTTTTGALAVAFFVTSLMLSILAGRDRTPASIFGTGGPNVPAAPGRGTDQTPLGQGGRGVLDTLRQGQGGEAPAGPEVPRSR